jgi:hypothetical protein
VLNSSQEAVLAQLFYAYNASYRHADDDVARAWYGWVFKNLNDCKENPLEGRYSLQLLYDWSSYRLSTIVAIPVILSLAIGTWYMMGQGDVVTAWTLALYIVTTAAGEFSILKTACVLLTARSAYCIDGDYREFEGHLGIVGYHSRSIWAYFALICTLEHWIQQGATYLNDLRRQIIIVVILNNREFPHITPLLLMRMSLGPSFPGAVELF